MSARAVAITPPTGGMRECMYVQSDIWPVTCGESGLVGMPDCTYMQWSAPACNRTLAADLRDLTSLTPRLVPLCCHLPPEGAHILAVPVPAAHLGCCLVDDAGLEPEPVGEHIAHRPFRDLAESQYGDADQPLSSGPVAERLIENSIRELSVFAAELAGSLNLGPVFRLGEAARRDALTDQPSVRLRLGALAKVGVGDVNVLADVKAQRCAVLAGGAVHRPPALRPLGDIKVRRDVLAEAFGGGKQACHPRSASPWVGMPEMSIGHTRFAPVAGSSAGPAISSRRGRSRRLLTSGGLSGRSALRRRIARLAVADLGDVLAAPLCLVCRIRDGDGFRAEFRADRADERGIRSVIAGASAGYLSGTSSGHA